MKSRKLITLLSIFLIISIPIIPIVQSIEQSRLIYSNKNKNIRNAKSIMENYILKNIKKQNMFIPIYLIIYLFTFIYLLSYLKQNIDSMIIILIGALYLSIPLSIFFILFASMRILLNLYLFITNPLEYIKNVMSGILDFVKGIFRKINVFIYEIIWNTLQYILDFIEQILNNEPLTRII